MCDSARTLLADSFRLHALSRETPMPTSKNERSGGEAVKCVSIATSRVLARFGSELSPLYRSASASWSFNFGWTFCLAAIPRRTDKGDPEYRDEEELNAFLLSHAEGFVPFTQEPRPLTLRNRKIDSRKYRIQFHCPHRVVDQGATVFIVQIPSRYEGQLNVTS